MRNTPHSSSIPNSRHLIPKQIPTAALSYSELSLSHLPSLLLYLEYRSSTHVQASCPPDNHILRLLARKICASLHLHCISSEPAFLSVSSQPEIPKKKRETSIFLTSRTSRTLQPWCIVICGLLLLILRQQPQGHTSGICLCCLIHTQKISRLLPFLQLFLQLQYLPPSSVISASRHQHLSAFESAKSRIY